MVGSSERFVFRAGPKTSASAHALLPEMVTATVDPLTVSELPLEIIPVCPLPVPKVCALVEAPVMVNVVAYAGPATSTAVEVMRR